MPQLTGPLLPEGALVDILVGWCQPDILAIRHQLRPVPAPVQLRAMIDTGAEVTCLDPSIIKTLALPLEKPTLANMPGGIGLTLSTLHRAGATLLHQTGDPKQHLVVPTLVVCELPLSILGYDAVVGRDILDRVQFLYDGPGRVFSIDY